MADVTVDATKVRPLDGAVVQSFAMGEAVTAGVGMLFRVQSDGTLIRADASLLAGIKGLLAIVVAGHRKNEDGTLASGETVSAVAFGPVAGFSSLAEETLHYVSETAGAIADAAPAFARAVGYPRAADVFFLDPDTGDPGS